MNNQDYRKILLAAAGFFFLLALYRYYASRQSTDSVRSAQNTTKLHITLYRSPSCPYCIKFAPTWESLKAKMPFAAFSSVDCSVDAAQCRGIEGVPMMVMRLDGKEGRISGAVSLETAVDRISEFVNRVKG